MSMAVYRCRKITISAVNGHAVCILLSTSIYPFTVIPPGGSRLDCSSTALRSSLRMGRS